MRVDARADGSGQVQATVALDREAAAAVPDLESGLRVDDLRRVGWTVTGPMAQSDGGMRLTAAHGFRSPAEGARLVEQLGAPFQSTRLSQKRTSFTTRTSFRAVVDLRESFADEKLRQIVDPSLLTADKIFTFDVEVRLPGKAAVWHPQPGQRLALRLQSTERDTGRIAAAAASIGAALALLVVLIRRALARGRRS